MAKRAREPSRSKYNGTTRCFQRVLSNPDPSIVNEKVEYSFNLGLRFTTPYLFVYRVLTTVTLLALMARFS